MSEHNGSSALAELEPHPVSRSRQTKIPELASAGSLNHESGDGKAATVPRFTAETIKRDALAGTITGLMAIPLTVGICLMSEYPVQIGLATVLVACVISFIIYLGSSRIRVGNFWSLNA